MDAHSFLKVIKPISGNDKWTYIIMESGYTENKVVNVRTEL
jgi:hypothetical protein